ncbi:hypothetical protein A3709_11930 [Halioglobus sp. HI00S01]|uniref:caspase family protein n=1 Tax=Halioglobus sp. HI00S01 TaxID=1822214 RepID=UPI0007C3AD48|nr:caspase family protein [Halioglobus sp. HI00S01]KZX60293.1 hypothetical protein A3709_11930 [Halioglobus sp. HI00S01]
MPPSRLHLLPGLVLLCAVLFSPLSLAARHALLVGVTDYPNLEGQNLTGSDNDVALAAEVLMARGFEATDITTLSESAGEGRRPIRANIMNELDALAAKAQAGDFVYLHFSGHGSQAPATGDDETDGLDELFLPADVEKWKGDADKSTVPNAITDNEMDTKLDAIRARGANIWLVFDSCHSGTMTRGASFNNMSFRQLAPGALGIPANAGITTRGGPAAGDDTFTSNLGAAADADTQRGYLVAFSAAQPTQTTPEMTLPPKGDDGKTYGVFTYNLMQVLANNRGISYAQLAEQVMLQYRQLPWRRTQPLVSGDALDETIFGEEERGYQVWPARANSRGDIKIEAGRLQHYTQESVINLYRSPLAREEDFVGQASIKEATAMTSKAKPLDFKGRDEQDPLYAVMKQPVADFTLSVAAIGPAAAKLAPLVAAAADKNPLLAVAAEGEPAAIRVAISGEQLLFLTQDQSLPCKDRGLPVDEIEPCNTERGPKQELAAEKFPLKDVEDLQIVASGLGRIARAESVIRMQPHIAAGSTGRSSLDVKLTIRKQGELSDYPLSEVPSFAAGDQVIVDIRNVSPMAQDISVLYRDAHFGLTQLWPVGDIPNRVGAGERLYSLPITLDAKTAGAEDLIILSQPGKGPISRDFAFLNQESLGSVTRGAATQSSLKLRGQGPQEAISRQLASLNKESRGKGTWGAAPQTAAPQTRVEGGPSLMQLLFDASVNQNEASAEEAKVLTRGASLAIRPEPGGMQIYHWEIAK